MAGKRGFALLGSSSPSYLVLPGCLQLSPRARCYPDQVDALCEGRGVRRRATIRRGRQPRKAWYPGPPAPRSSVTAACNWFSSTMQIERRTAGALAGQGPTRDHRKAFRLKFSDRLGRAPGAQRPERARRTLRPRVPRPGAAPAPSGFLEVPRPSPPPSRQLPLEQRRGSDDRQCCRGAAGPVPASGERIQPSRPLRPPSSGLLLVSGIRVLPPAPRLQPLHEPHHRRFRKPRRSRPQAPRSARLGSGSRPPARRSRRSALARLAAAATASP